MYSDVHVMFANLNGADFYASTIYCICILKIMNEHLKVIFMKNAKIQWLAVAYQLETKWVCCLIIIIRLTS